MVLCNTLKCFIIYFLYFIVNCHAQNSEINSYKLSNCKKQSMYNKDERFPINEVEQKLDANVNFNLTFYAICYYKNLAIVLSTQPNESKSKFIYKISIGCGTNQSSSIRGLSTQIILNSYNLMPFTISKIEVVQKKDGHLQVYTSNSPNYMYIGDSNSFRLPIKYVRLSSGAKWFHSCDYLDKELLTHLNERVLKSNTSPLPDVVKYSFNIKSDSPKLNSVYPTAVIHFFFKWNDARLSWNPDNFNGIESMNLPTNSFDIFYPKLTVTNNIEKKVEPISSKLEIQSNGNVSLVFEFVNSSSPNSKNKDQHNFDLNFRLIDNRKISFIYDDSQPILQDKEVSLIAWQIKHTNISNKIWKIIDIKTIFSINRNEYIFQNSKYFSTLVLQILVILSFLWSRTILIWTFIFAVCINLVYLAFVAPDLIIAYDVVLVVMLLFFVQHGLILYIEIYSPKQNPGNKMDSKSPENFNSIQKYPYKDAAKILSYINFVIAILIFGAINMKMYDIVAVVKQIIYNIN